jgi:hypothetical protein
MKYTIITLIMFLFLLTACDNGGNPDTVVPDPDADTYIPYTIAYSAGGTDISRFLEWEWEKEGTDFTWLFQPDGSVTVVHCCGDIYVEQFSYLFQGNVLVTYGHETRSDEFEVTNFIMADDDLSFTRDNGTKFTRGSARDTASTLNLSNKLLGTWHGEDGTEYVFGSDAGLRINSVQYGYFVRYAELLPLGPLVDGTSVVLQKYRFNRDGNKLYLRASDGKRYTLSFSE